MGGKKEKSEAGERETEGLTDMKKAKKRLAERQIGAEGWRPVPYPTTEVAVLASAGAAGIR